MTTLDDVRVRQVQTSWRLAMAAGWLAFLGLVAAGLALGVRHLLTSPWRASRKRLPRRVTRE